MLEYQNQKKSLIVRPTFEAPGAEDSDAIPIVVQAVDMDGNPVDEELAFDVRVSEDVTGLAENYGKYTGVIGAATNSGAVFAAHANNAFGSILYGTGAATATVRTNTAGYVGFGVAYAGAGTFYVGAEQTAFGSNLIVGDQVAVITFAS